MKRTCGHVRHVIVSIHNNVLTTYLYIHINNNKPHVNTSTYILYIQHACIVNIIIYYTLYYCVNYTKRERNNCRNKLFAEK